MPTIFINILGWTGTIILLLAYFLVVTGRLRATSYIYNVCNFIGGCLLGIYALIVNALPAFVFSFVRILIAVYIIGRTWNNRR